MKFHTPLLVTMSLLAPLASAQEVVVTESEFAGVPVQRWTAPTGGDFYRVALDGEHFSRVRPARTTLHLQRAVFDPLVSTPDFEHSRLEGGGNVHIIQFATQSLEAYRDELTDMGVRVWHFLPYQAHLAWIEPDLLAQVRSLPYVR